jgi:hypothetical protein
MVVTGAVVAAAVWTGAATAQDGGAAPPPPPPPPPPSGLRPDAGDTGLPDGGSFLPEDQMPVFDPFAEPAPALEQPRELQPGELVLDPTPLTPGLLRTPAPPPEAPRVAASQAPGAVLRALDRLSGEVRDLELRQGETVEFGRITVTLGECRYPTDNPAGDAFAHVQVRRAGVEAAQFDGWMVASSPALSALDDPRYDVWVSRCTTS